MLSDEEIKVRALHGQRVKDTLTEIGKVWKSNKDELPNARSYDVAALHRSLKDALDKMNEAFNLG
jgi:hypothetical protein